MNRRTLCGKLCGLVLAAALLLAALSGCSASPSHGLTVYAFPVGAGDAFLITTENAAVLIDCGQKGCGKEIAAYLAEQGIAKLDLLILTHFDKDHIGGAEKIIRSVAIDRVLQSIEPTDSSAYEKYLAALSAAGIEPETVAADLAFTLDGASYRIDAPAGGYSSDRSNNSSLIVMIEYEGSSLLFMGDAEKERISEFLDSHAEPFTFLKVPHHGRKGKMTAALIRSVSPKIALITSSESEPEDEDVVRWLEQAGAEVCLTRKGAVVLTFDNGGANARCAPP